MNKVRVFMSFDLDHDQDLHDLLLEQCSRGDSGFEIAARSEEWMTANPWDGFVRRRFLRILDADVVIVICGEHTETSSGVSAELQIAQDEQKPYFLLWGRRESMCTKPASATSKDNMYSWTWQILQNQIAMTLHRARGRGALTSLAR
jgi:hypothetical protein